MAFFKKVKKKLTGLWYPEAITVGKPVTTDQVADRLALISTVSRGDTYAVLKDLGVVMAAFMAEGRTVKLEGVGTFYYTINADNTSASTTSSKSELADELYTSNTPCASAT